MKTEKIQQFIKKYGFASVPMLLQTMAEKRYDEGLMSERDRKAVEEIASELKAALIEIVE